MNGVLQNTASDKKPQQFVQRWRLRIVYEGARFVQTAVVSFDNYILQHPLF